MAQYFLLSMGGFVVQVGRGRVRLSTERLVTMYEEDIIHIPQIDKLDIDDRSKVYHVVKSLALIQAPGPPPRFWDGRSMACLRPLWSSSPLVSFSAPF
jgi:hypothetical protein